MITINIITPYVLSTIGVLEAGCGAFAQVLADCLVRQGLPGYCLGRLKRKSNRKIIGEYEGMDVDQDNPEEEENDQQQPILDGEICFRTVSAFVAFPVYQLRLGI